MDKVLMDSFKYSISFISPRIRMSLERLNEGIIETIQEIRLRVGRPVTIVTANGCSFLTSGSRLTYILSANCIICSENEIIDTVEKMCCYSIHSYIEDIKNGYIALGNGSRVGVIGTAVIENNTIKSIKEISSLNIRIPRNVRGVSNIIFEKIFNEKNSPENLIIAGAPSSGKSTMLKDLAYQLSSGRLGKYYKICVIDERKELFSSSNDYNQLGPNTDVLSGFPKSKGIEIATRTMSPEVILCDEIGNMNEFYEIIAGVNSGIKFILTLHAETVDELKRKFGLNELLKNGNFEKIVLLSGQHSPCNIEKIVSSYEVIYENTFNHFDIFDKCNHSNKFDKAN